MSYIETATKIVAGDVVTHPGNGKRVTIVDRVASRRADRVCFVAEGVRGGAMPVVFVVGEGVEVHNR